MVQRHGFSYPSNPIGTIKSLALHLRVTEEYLNWALKHADRSAYYVRRRERSSTAWQPDKVTYEAHDWLKQVQEKLLVHLLRKVQYPPFVVGGVPGRDLRMAVERHLYARSLMTFDVSRFFESTSLEQVRTIYKRFFCFPEVVAEALCRLTTVNGHLPRGASTSSYLANLVFFAEESALVDRLGEWDTVPFRYSRWIDDITITSRAQLTDSAVEQVTGLVAQMLSRHRLQFSRERDISPTERRKRRVVRSSRVIVVHNIQIRGGRMSVSKQRRNELRRTIYYLEGRSKVGPLCTNDKELLVSTQSLLGYLGPFHPKLSAEYRVVLSGIRHREREWLQNAPIT